jgi:type II secretory pathway pseudopilin PulG
MSMTTIHGERGFTLVELLVSSAITMAVLGGAVAMTSQVQRAYRLQVEDSAAEQEGRYALEWISRMIRAAGNNPYSKATSVCPDDDPLTDFTGLIMDPDGEADADDIRVQTDSNPPDGLLGGSTGACNQANEDVTISFDPDTNAITFFDNNLGGDATIRTDAVIDNLAFIYRDVNHDVTTNANNVVYVETQVTIRTRTIDAATGLPVTRLLTQEVRLRGRNY